VADFELENYHFLKDLVQEHDIPCDWASHPVVHAYLDEDMFSLVSKSVADLKKRHPDLGNQVQAIGRDDEGGQEKLASLKLPGIPGAVVQQHAASLWPYKLVSWVLERLIDTLPASEFNLQTNTPVVELHKNTQSDGGWIVGTSRGRIAANTVLLCTNGYTSALLPSFSDLIVPTRGQIAAVLPPRAQSSSVDGQGLPARLDYSYSFRGTDSGSDGTTLDRNEYLIQRPLPGGEHIFGGGRNRAADLGVGKWRDDIVEVPVSKWLRGNLSPPLDLTPPGETSKPPAEADDLDQQDLLNASFEWTGIMGYSRDGHPWVGAVPESAGGGDGLWISAGYTGHGMPAAALSARSVVSQISGDEDKSPVPDAFRVSEERIQQARSKYASVAEMARQGRYMRTFWHNAEQDVGSLDS
jgi:glycine/D-amino acid oxidase-like deaminating enzyme